ncbi:MAG: hypothetical protein ACR65R_01525, partial [Methylomicrobium sp.]
GLWGNQSSRPEKTLPLQNRSPEGGNSAEFRLIADYFVFLTFLHGLGRKCQFNCHRELSAITRQPKILA